MSSTLRSDKHCTSRRITGKEHEEKDGPTSTVLWAVAAGRGAGGPSQQGVTGFGVRVQAAHLSGHVDREAV